MKKEAVSKNEDRPKCWGLTERDVREDKESLIKKFESLGYEIDHSNIKQVNIGRPPLGRVYLVKEKDESEWYAICGECYNNVGIMRKDWMNNKMPHEYATSVFWYGMYYGACRG